MSTANTLYKGQSSAPLILIQDNTGAAISHANVLALHVVVFAVYSDGSEESLTKFMKGTPDTGYTQLIQESGAGKYTAKIERSDSQNYPADTEIWIEVKAKVSSDVLDEETHYVSRQHIYNCKSAQTQTI